MGRSFRNKDATEIRAKFAPPDPNGTTRCLSDKIKPALGWDNNICPNSSPKLLYRMADPLSSILIGRLCIWMTNIIEWHLYLEGCSKKTSCSSVVSGKSAGGVGSSMVTSLAMAIWEDGESRWQEDQACSIVATVHHP